MTGDLHRYLPDEEWFRFNPRGIHGAPHTTRVLVWSQRIADTVGRKEAIRREELLWAAAVHDVGRVDDGSDHGHGRRSAAWVQDRISSERPETANLDLAFIAELCTWHEVPDERIECLSLELVILKDADALDRCRIHDLDPFRLRLTATTRLVEAAERLEMATDRYGRMTAAEVLGVAIELEEGPSSLGQMHR